MAELAGDLELLVGYMREVESDLKNHTMPEELMSDIDSISVNMKDLIDDISDVVEKIDSLPYTELVDDIKLIVSHLPNSSEESWDQGQVRRAAERIQDVVLSLRDIRDNL